MHFRHEMNGSSGTIVIVVEDEKALEGKLYKVMDRCRIHLNEVRCYMRRRNDRDVVQLVHIDGKVDVVRVEREINEGRGVHAMGRSKLRPEGGLAIDLPFVENRCNNTVADLTISRRVNRFNVITINMVSKVSVMNQGQGRGIIHASLVDDSYEDVVDFRLGCGFVGTWSLCRVIR